MVKSKFKLRFFVFIVAATWCAVVFFLYSGLIFINNALEEDAKKLEAWLHPTLEQAQAEVAVFPKEGGSYLHLGFALMDMKEYTKAEAAFRKAIHLAQIAKGKEHPWIDNAYLYLGKSLLAQGKRREACGELEKLVELSPPIDVDAYNASSEAYRMLKEIK